MDGFEPHLAAALRKKELPLIMVADREQADFEIKGTPEQKPPGLLGDRPSASPGIWIVNLKTYVVVYADRSGVLKGERSTAEKLAKYLKKKIEEDEKKK